MKIRFANRAGKSDSSTLAAYLVFDDGRLAAETAFEPAVRVRLQKELAAKSFAGKAQEGLVLQQAAGWAYFVGLGSKAGLTAEGVRRAAARALAQAKALKLRRLRLSLDTVCAALEPPVAVAAAAEGLRLADYRFDRYKSKKSKPGSVAEALLYQGRAARPERLTRALREAEIVADAVYFTRDLANEPANHLGPEELARRAQAMARENGLSCRVLGKSQIRRLGMGGILGVSRGSAREPRFIILEYRPARPRFGEPIVLVGKGITFDTGGISIKPSGDMDKMKFDMCGAAAVLGAMKAVAALKLPVRVVALVPTCENMPDGDAQRPGDILRCLNGKTVEVLNTDAEGRLILADALAYAARYKPKALLDIATLTGACAATFADLAVGLMGTDPDLVDRVRRSGERTGERCWELPLWEEYAELIRATYADLQNISKKYAGTITAGMFLKEFAGHTRSWVHLDIAGTAWNEGGPKALSPIGATGVGVRLFVETVKSYL